MADATEACPQWLPTASHTASCSTRADRIKTPTQSPLAPSIDARTDGRRTPDGGRAPVAQTSRKPRERKHHQAVTVSIFGLQSCVFLWHKSYMVQN